MVFDEAHNIDNVCIEALSIDVDRRILAAATANLTRLERNVAETKDRERDKLEEEYQRLLSGFGGGGAGSSSSSSGSGSGSGSSSGSGSGSGSGDGAGGVASAIAMADEALAPPIIPVGAIPNSILEQVSLFYLPLHFK